MRTFYSYDLLVTPLSPVHIGTGNSYEPTNYVIEDDALHEFDLGDVVEVLFPSDRDSLMRIVERRPDENMIKSVQTFFYERRADLLPRARSPIRVLGGVADFYRGRVGKTVQRERGSEQVINKLEIDRTAFNPVTRKPVLFGSSLKGAIRTALLDTMNAGRPLQATENNGLLQQRLFAFRPGKFERDPLRLLQISDAWWSSGPGLPGTEVHLAVNRKKKAVVDERGDLRPSQAEQKGLYQILECVPALRYRAFEARLNIQDVNHVNKPDRLPDPSLRFDIGQIVRACNAFYRPILMEENRLLSDRGFLNESWRNAVETALTGKLDQRMDRGEVFLIRVGRHSGAESVTLNGVRSIRIMKGQGQWEDAPQTKTAWLAADSLAQQKDMFPFGWLLVEVYPVDGPRKGCEAIESVCEAQLGPTQIWAKRQQQLAEERGKKAIEQEMRRRLEDEEARLTLEKKTRAERSESDRLARLAAMSDEERAIEALREIYERDKKAQRKEVGGELNDRRVALLKKAKTWDHEIRRKAADLIEETVGWLPWGGNKQKVAERRKELKELRLD